MSTTSQRGGVADYFAILGIGDDLILKSTQKKLQRVANSSGRDCDAEEQRKLQKQIGEEEECAMVERFFREIVEVTILTVYSDRYGNDIGGTLVSTISASMSDELDINGDESDYYDEEREYASSCPSSPPCPPSPSDVTSEMNTLPSDDILHSPQSKRSVSIPVPLSQLNCGKDNDPLAREISGYDILYYTAPAGKGSMDVGTPKNQLGPNDSFATSQQDSSFQDPNTSINTTLSLNTSIDTDIGGAIGPLWSKAQTLDADLNPELGLRASILSNCRQYLESQPSGEDPNESVDSTGSRQAKKLGRIRKRLIPGISKLRDRIAPIVAAKATISMEKDIEGDIVACQKRFYLGYRRRGADEISRPAIANMTLLYCRIHRYTIIPAANTTQFHFSDEGEKLEEMSPKRRMIVKNAKRSAAAIRKGIAAGAGMAARVAMNGNVSPRSPSSPDSHEVVELQDLLTLPAGCSEWVIPDLYHHLRLPLHSNSQEKYLSSLYLRRSPTGDGVETYLPSQSFSFDERDGRRVSAKYMPTLISSESLSDVCDTTEDGDSMFEYIPIIALRRQRITEEERFHEDPGIVDMAMTFLDQHGDPIMPLDDDIYDENDNEEDDRILGKSNWCMSNHGSEARHDPSPEDGILRLGLPIVIQKCNLPLGFADAPFATSVLDRFPKKDYKGFPMPQEELPMFCYPTGEYIVLLIHDLMKLLWDTWGSNRLRMLNSVRFIIGCRLVREKYQNAPLNQTYGFVVKNERGDSIYVSCVSFMEPLTSSKMDQLDQISELRKNSSLPHRLFCERHQRTESDGNIGNDLILMGFEEMTVFENKTICLVSRYPFWTAFKQFLTHLQVISGSSSDLPIERMISHLLYSVPKPKPGGQAILVPLPALQSNACLLLPPSKDFPLLDLSYQRLFCCLDVPTVVTLVLGFLALERKLIIMSTDPSIVTDTCELLRSLLFPFELCAPYVPRLTTPFMSVLNFPGAIFAGIHDDLTPDGLAATVRAEIPENTAILDVDTGEIDCDGDRYEMLKECWDIIPSEPRSSLVSEVEKLCEDSGITPGESSEALGIEVSPVILLTDEFLGEDSVQPLDDRAIRDCFLRFFCSILAGYERFLLVPDIDFLISGNDWFDTEGFLASIATQPRSEFLQSLISTQLFQSFIQKRTEASDVHCLLFDECLAEFHSSKALFGRQHKEIDNSDESVLLYDLLVDQCAAEGFECHEADEDVSTADTSFLTTHTDDGDIINSTGDLVCLPSQKELPQGAKYVYCIDGQSVFPSFLDPELFYPREAALADNGVDDIPIQFSVLTRSDREHDASALRRKLASCHRGVQRQRRCLFQLPKLMASHFLNTWLMCIPSQLSQDYLMTEQQSKVLLRGLGALRLLRNRQRIVPDEAGYRCLIVACGSCDSDKRIEVVKLFGLLRSDGIFPSAVTLGQYTKAIAEGFGKKSSEANPSIVGSNVYMTDHTNEQGLNDIIHEILKGSCDCLDGNLSELEDAGRSWRNNESKKSSDRKKGNEDMNVSVEKKQDSVDISHIQQDKKEKKRHRGWSPILCSSSFPLHCPIEKIESLPEAFRLFAIWSRFTRCECSYIPLDEEIQAGWDEKGEDDETDSILCPCCGATLYPQLGYKIFEESAVQSAGSSPQKNKLPFQLDNIPSKDQCDGVVPYISPSKLRITMERYVEEFGQSVLEREKLQALDPCLFYNFWWYCARFNLPLPLPINIKDGHPSYWCAFAAWDKSIAEEGMTSARKTVESLQSNIQQGKNGDVDCTSHLVQSVLDDHFPLVANFSLQSFAQSDWDHTDLSSILVPLVEACDKRDFHPIICRILQCNEERRSKAEVEFDYYRTILYLTRYQCTSAFHRFFPATCRTCKGYHFWCPHGTVPIFDRMFRDAVEKIGSKGDVTFHCLSDVSLGFRNVFGHII